MKTVMNLKISSKRGQFFYLDKELFSFTRTLLHVVRHNSFVYSKVLSNGLSFPSDSSSKIFQFS